MRIPRHDRQIENHIVCVRACVRVRVDNICAFRRTNTEHSFNPLGAPVTLHPSRLPRKLPARRLRLGALKFPHTVTHIHANSAQIKCKSYVFVKFKPAWRCVCVCELHLHARTSTHTHTLLPNVACMCIYVYDYIRLYTEYSTMRLRHSNALKTHTHTHTCAGQERPLRRAHRRHIAAPRSEPGAYDVTLAQKTDAFASALSKTGATPLRASHYR